MLGRILSHYKILDELSRGGMGVVYRAVDTKLNREVAIKVLPAELVSDPDRKQRFTQEAQAAATLEHPHIAVIYEIDEVEGVTFIAMELIRGEKLRDRLARESLTAARALELATEIAEGLACAHDRGIVHRDLKSANAMVTAEGHVKIIDFGLAKLLPPLMGDESEIATAQRRETDPGVVMGTVSYMSPEQARGTKVDHRSDVFSFGVLLYEMLARKLPFQGQSSIETLNAILKEAPPRLGPLETGVSAEATAEIQRILDKCLAKDPSDRYQTMKDAVVDLRSVRRRLESGSVGPVTGGFEGRRSILKGLTGIAAAATLLLLGAVLFFVLSRDEPRQRDTAPSGRPSLAVLYFENVTGDSSLDWLRTGLTDMLVTDLSQSPRLEVLSTDRLYQILKEMNRLDERVTSLEVVEGVAERAGVGTILLGSFMKAGDNIRINLRIQEASSGRILTSERVEGVGESSLFAMVDELTRRIQARVAIAAEADERNVEDITTSSLEAYRYYVEAAELADRSKTEEAILLYEKAVERDPGFATALVNLAIEHWKLGHQKEYEDYTQRALEHSDRLTPPERLYIEATYYSLTEETFGRSIAAFKEAVESYPDSNENVRSAQNDLGWAYLVLERYDEAIEVLEARRRARDEPFLGTYVFLTTAHTALGNRNEGARVMEDFLRQEPQMPPGYVALGFHRTDWGELDGALEAFRKAESLDPRDLSFEEGRWQVFGLREDWERADEAARKLAGSPVPSQSAWGSFELAWNRLHRGESRVAVERFLETAAANAERPHLSAFARDYASHLLLQRGEPTRALDEAEKAQVEGKGTPGEWEGLFYAAMARAALGQWDAAGETAEKLRLKAESLPTEKEKRRYHHLAGELALARGGAGEAVRELERAASMLPHRGVGGFSTWVILPQHVPIGYSMASAYLASGDEDRAFEWFQRVVESGTERLYWPIPVVRSFYFLGKIHEHRGETEKSTEYYRRFVEHWKDGDLDRERVEEARSKL